MLKIHDWQADMFRALGHPVRVEILKMLSNEEICVCEMLPRLEIEQSTLSKHLSVLRKADLVVSRREGTTVVYRLASPLIKELLKVSEEMIVEQVRGMHKSLEEMTAGE